MLNLRPLRQGATTAPLPLACPGFLKPCRVSSLVRAYGNKPLPMPHSAIEPRLSDFGSTEAGGPLIFNHYPLCLSVSC